jgi:hypothetical protein
MLDALKFYINPEMYKTEKEYEAGTHESQIRENRDFAQHYRSAIAGGGIKLSPEMRKVLDDMKEKKRKEKEQKNLRIQSIDGVDPSEDDEGTLGT